MTAPIVTPVSVVVRIPLDRIKPGPNVRGDVGDVSELALSINSIGMQKPLIVHDLGDGAFQIFDGHRRYAAAQQLGLATADAIVKASQPDVAGRALAQLAMHTHGKSFDPIAEAKALHGLMFQHKLSREQIAGMVGRSPGWVRDRIALLKLSGNEQRDIAAGRMSVVEAALRIKNRDGDKPKAGPPNAAAVEASGKRHCRTCQCGGTS